MTDLLGNQQTGGREVSKKGGVQTPPSSLLATVLAAAVD